MKKTRYFFSTTDFCFLGRFDNKDDEDVADDDDDDDDVKDDETSQSANEGSSGVVGGVDEGEKRNQSSEVKTRNETKKLFFPNDWELARD